MKQKAYETIKDIFNLANQLVSLLRTYFINLLPNTAMSNQIDSITDNQIVWLQLAENINDNFRKCTSMESVSLMIKNHEELLALAAAAISDFAKEQ